MSEEKKDKVKLSGGSTVQTDAQNIPTNIELHIEKILKKYLGIIITAIFAFIFGIISTVLWELNSKISTNIGQFSNLDRLYETEGKLLKETIELERMQRVVTCMKDRKIVNKSVCNYGN